MTRNLWKILDEHLEKGDCSPYDYYRHGCALSCVQWINEALNETYGKDVHIHYTAWPEHFNRTPREIGGAAAAISPWTQYIIYFIVGNEMDRPVRKEYKLILPADLAYAWQQATVNGDTLLSSEAHVLVDATHTSHATHVTPTMVACLMVVLALLTFFVPKPWAFGIDSIIIGIQTLLGCFMTYLVGFSDLCCTDWNWLLIAFNPLPLFLLLSLRKNARHRLLGWFAFGLAVVNIVWCVVMLCVPRTIVIAPHILQTLACSICMMHLATAWAKVVVAPHLTKVSNQSPS